MNEKKLYNGELKERYLSENFPDENTKKNYRDKFYRASKLEHQLCKDICEFNPNDFNNLLSSFGNVKSIDSITAIMSIIRGYVNWCGEQGYIASKMNYTELFGGRELEKYVNKIALDKKYLKDKYELYDILNICRNSQDAVIFTLLYEGVKGEGYEELINLKAKDCDENTNIITLTRNNGQKRQIKVSNITMETIKDAINQEEYFSNNGLSEGRTKSRKIFANEYVLRPAGRQTFDPMDLQGISRRIKYISKLYGNDFLTANNIRTSGMINFAKELKKETGKSELEREEYYIICDKFDESRASWFAIKRRIDKHI